MRTPLAPALAGATYLINNASKFPPEFAEDLKIIKRNVQLQARLIDDLLDLTRITRGKLQLHLDSVDANTLVREAIDIANSAIAAKKLKVSQLAQGKGSRCALEMEMSGISGKRSLRETRSGISSFEK